MSAVFTDLLHALDAEGSCNPASYTALREALRGPLIHQMRIRGLWEASPAYLGVYGGNSWQEASLFNELVHDCISYIFVRRLAGLLNQLRVRPNVDGLVFRNIRNFLYDRQRKHDPLGFRIFEILEAAIRRLLDARRLYLVENGPKIRNPTVFAFTPWGTTDPEAPDFGSRVRAWNDELMPGLVGARGQARRTIETLLGDHIAALAEAVEAFRFKDLVDPMKHDARQRATVLLSEEADLAEEGEDLLLTFVPPEEPSAELEQRQRFQALSRCVEESLDRSKKTERKRDRLRQLLALLRARVESGEKSLSNLATARLLGFPKDSIRGLKAQLSRFAEDCLEASSSYSTTRRIEDSSLGPGMGQARQEGNSAMSITPAERQRLRIEEEAEKISRARAEARDIPQSAPCPGETYLLRETSSHGIEWLVVDTDEERLLVVPVDDNPMVGTKDVEASSDWGGPVSVRSDFAVWIAAGAFEPELQTGALTEETLDDVRRKRADIEARILAGTELQQEVDDSPAYQTWVGDVLKEARTALLDSSQAQTSARKTDAFPAARRWASVNNPLALAASILMMVSLGLTGGLWKQRHSIGILEEELARSDLDRQRLERETRLLEQVIGTQEKPPQINLPFVHFTREDPVRGPGKPLLIPEAAKRIALILEVVKPELYPRYRLEVLDAETESKVWTSDRLTRTGSELSLDLPRSILSTGNYLLRVYGLGETQSGLLEEYRLAIQLD